MPSPSSPPRTPRPKRSHTSWPSGGLYLYVQTGGSKLWRLKYRYAEKEKVLSFGPYPLITIAEARGKRDEAKKLLLAGLDPSAKRAPVFEGHRIWRMSKCGR